MEQKKKLLKTLSIVEFITGIVYCIEGFVVATGKAPYFISGAVTVVTAVLCYLAADDSTKAKPATILLLVSIILSLVAVIAAFVNGISITSIGGAVVDICIAAYLVKTIKEIHG